eukprot:Gb_37321 [translate_table: standard]
MESDECTFSTDYDTISDFLSKGDVFVIIAPPDNSKNVQYYLLQCIASKIILNVESTDADGFTYPTGSMVVMGHFFQNIAQNDSYMTYKDYHIDMIVF